MKHKYLLNYILAIILTIFVFLMLFMVISFPMIFVFFIDDAFSFQEYWDSFLWIFYILLFLNLLIVFPINLIFDYLKKYNKNFDWIYLSLFLAVINIFVYLMPYGGIDILHILVISVSIIVYRIIYKLLKYI